MDKNPGQVEVKFAQMAAVENAFLVGLWMGTKKLKLPKTAVYQKKKAIKFMTSHSMKPIWSFQAATSASCNCIRLKSTSISTSKTLMTFQNISRAAFTPTSTTWIKFLSNETFQCECKYFWPCTQEKSEQKSVIRLLISNSKPFLSPSSCSLPSNRMNVKCVFICANKTLSLGKYFS